MIINFTEFIFQKVYNNKFKEIDETLIRRAFEQTVADYNYKNNVKAEEVLYRIINNYNELGVYLYRLGRILYEDNSSEDLILNIHWLMKELCSMEIFLSTDIDVGFNISHGEGTVIGPRHKIGKGFTIHQGCTIGKRNNINDKVIIGNNVTMYANSMILGNIIIDDDSVISANKIIK